MGYLGLPELTRDTLSPDGWLKSGDIGYISEVSNLYTPFPHRGGQDGNIQVTWIKALRLLGCIVYIKGMKMGIPP